jgi:hypothetical protein
VGVRYYWKCTQNVMFTMLWVSTTRPFQHRLNNRMKQVSLGCCVQPRMHSKITNSSSLYFKKTCKLTKWLFVSYNYCWFIYLNWYSNLMVLWFQVMSNSYLLAILICLLFQWFDEELLLRIWYCCNCLITYAWFFFSNIMIELVCSALNAKIAIVFMSKLDNKQYKPPWKIHHNILRKYKCTYDPLIQFRVHLGHNTTKKWSSLIKVSFL